MSIAPMSESLDFYNALQESNAPADIKEQFESPPNIIENTHKTAREEKMNSKMLVTSLNDILKWDDDEIDNGLKNRIIKLADKAGKYYDAHSNMSWPQLHELQEQRRTGQQTRNTITNDFNSWLVYQNELVSAYEGILEDLPLPALYKFTFLRNSQGINGKGAHCEKCTKNPFRDLINGETYSFSKPSNFNERFAICAPTRKPAALLSGNDDSIKEYVIGRLNNPLRYGLFTRETYEDNFSGSYIEDGSFYAYSEPNGSKYNAIDIYRNKNSKHNWQFAAPGVTNGVAKWMRYQDTF